jgi:hypothetical protein
MLLKRDGVGDTLELVDDGGHDPYQRGSWFTRQSTD